MQPDRIRTTVEHDDAGRPLLLLNGIGSSNDVFEPLRAHLDDRMTIGLDAPGVGASPALKSMPSLRCFARVVADVCDRLTAGPIDVLGVSWGGFLAQELAHRHPRLVRRLVLVSTSPGSTAVLGCPTTVAKLSTPHWAQNRARLRRIAPRLYGDEVLLQPALLERQIQIRAALPPSRIGYLQQFAAAARWTSLPWLHKLDQPTLVLHGDCDAVLPLANARLLAARLPQARLRVIEGGAHLFHLVHAAETAATVTEFLDEN